MSEWNRLETGSKHEAVVFRCAYNPWVAGAHVFIFGLFFLSFGCGVFFYPDKSVGFTVFLSVMWLAFGIGIYDSLFTRELLLFNDRLVKRYSFAKRTSSWIV
jgi:hypothetical protein